MAWRPNEQFIEGVLDNTVPDKVTGWMKFSGIQDSVIIDLEGNFHRDVRGAKLRLRGDGEEANAVEARKYLEGFSTMQKGNVGDMTAGREPCDYGSIGCAYFEWYSEDNGRVVIELDSDQVELLTRPIPACESDPIDRKKQTENMAGFLCSLAEALNIPVDNAIAVGQTAAVERAKKIMANDKIRGMKLLPDELRRQLPPLGAQDGKLGKAIVYAKLFTPSSSWTWYILEGQPVLSESGTEVDFECFGLVYGHEREFGYFMLGELEEVKGPLGLPIERDLYFQPKTLAEIAPEMCRDD